MISRQPVPADVIRGVDTRIPLDLRDDEGAPVTVDSASVSVRYGTLEVASGTADVVDGVASFLLLGTITSAYAVGPSSGDWSIVWTDVVVSAPEVDAGTYRLRRALVLVATPLVCPITDDDLTSDAPSLAEMVPPSDGTYSGFRVAAFQRFVRKLKRGGKIAGLVLDPDAAVDYLIADALAAIYREHQAAIGDPRYAELAKFYAERAASEWADLVVQYDRWGQGGPAGPDASASPAAPVLFTSRPPRRGYWRT